MNIFGRFNINWLFVILFLTVLFIFYFHVAISPSYYHMGKASFLYFEVETPKGINLIMFRNSNLTFSAKSEKNRVRF